MNSEDACAQENPSGRFAPRLGAPSVLRHTVVISLVLAVGAFVAACGGSAEEPAPVPLSSTAAPSPSNYAAQAGLDFAVLADHGASSPPQSQVMLALAAEPDSSQKLGDIAELGSGSSGAVDAEESAPPAATDPAEAINPDSNPSAENMSALAASGSVAVPAAADVIAQLDAGLPMGQQTWTGVNCHGRTGRYASLPDLAISGARLADGNTLRFGRGVDPLVPSRRAFVFRVGTGDTLFADSRRCEVLAYPEVPAALPVRQNFWYAVTLLVDSGANSRGDDQLLTQWHAQGYNPLMAMYLSNGRLRITLRHNNGPVAGKVVNITPWVDSVPVSRRWMTFVFNAKLSASPSDLPYLRVWRDGVPIVNYSGPIGYKVQPLPYPKVGFYSWNDRNPWDTSVPVRTTFVRRAVTLRDPTSKFSEASIRTWVDRN